MVGVGGDRQVVLGDGFLRQAEAAEKLRPVVTQYRTVQALGVGTKLGIQPAQPVGDEGHRLLWIAQVHRDQGQAVLLERQGEQPALILG
jgi:hypothetical protein